MAEKFKDADQADGRRPSSKRARNLPARPSDAALRLLGRASDRVQDRNTAVRQAFIVRASGLQASDPAPPLADVLGTPKTGAFRLRLQLALLWQAGGGDERHSVTWPARTWAQLLDLPDPEGRGDRRVRAALKSLSARGLVELAADAGKPTGVILRRDDGEGGAYTHPGKDARATKAQGHNPADDLYVQLPPSYWSRGWGIALSGPAVAMLLVLLDLTNNGSRSQQWISPGRARARYGLTEDTWSRGVGDLSRSGLITIGKKRVQEDFGWRRVRNVYSVNLDRLEAEPEWGEPSPT